MLTELVLLISMIIIVAIVAFCGLTVYLEQHFPSEKYDERQKIARGNAFRFSWYIGMAYYFCLLIYFAFHTGNSGWILEPFLLVMIGILLQLQGFHIYCLMTHSALPLGEKPIPTIIGFLLLGAMYLVQYFMLYIPDDVVGFTGSQSMNLLRLLIALSFFSLAILHLISNMWKEKE